MKWKPMSLITALLLCLVSVPSSADENATPPLPLHQLIDQEIARGYAARNITPTPLANDEEFVRRIYLDLTGSIPSAVVTREFLADTASDKREKLIDRLLDSQAYAYHMQRIFDVMLLERQHANYVTVDEWQKYLRASFAADKPWDQFISELLTTSGTDPETRPAIRFLLVRTIDSYRRLEPHMVTRDVGRLLFGQNLQCARCHDHPSIDAYHQSDYYGIFAYFQWSIVSTAKIGEESKFVIADQPRKTALYTSVFMKDQPDQMAHLQLPGNEPFTIPVIEEGQEYVEKPEEGKVPIPAFSPRDRLANELKVNSAFRKNIVNRLWAMMLGRGIVHPVDLHHPGNPPSHPELLELMAERFAADGFRIKPFLREVALSETYQRSSAAADSETVYPPDAFARGSIRLMSPEQFGISVMQGTGLTDAQRVGLKDPADETTILDFQMANLKVFIELYGRPIGQAENDFDSNLFQALFYANGTTVLDWIRPRPQSLADRLQQQMAPGEFADELYLSVFSRHPTSEETATVAEYLSGRDNDRLEAIQELIWACIASSEFRFNH